MTTPLFQFELAPVEEVTPWGTGDDVRSLNWYALTEGSFRMPVGGQVLFEYSDEMRSRWPAGTSPYATYYVVAFVRDILSCAVPGIAPLPPFFAELVTDWNRLARLHWDSEEDIYTAFRWLGERSPWISYLRAGPDFAFIRTGDDVQIHWDNRRLTIDGIQAWTATEGSYFLPVDEFLRECHGFADRLLAAMKERIDGIEAGTMRPRVEVDVPSLREQHERFRAEFAEYLDRDYREPDIPWDEAEAAMRALAAALEDQR